MEHRLAPASARERVQTSPRGAGVPEHWLLLARLGWLSVASVTLVHFIASLPVLDARFKMVCADCLLQPSNVVELGSLGLSVDFFATYLIVLAMLFAVMYFTVGAVLFWRRSQDRLALLVALVLVTIGGTSFGGSFDMLTPVAPAWQAAVTVVYALGRMSLVLFLYLFPDGRFWPRWTGALALAAMALAGATALLEAASVSGWLTSASGLALTALLATLLAAGVCIQLYKYWSISGPVQRQQTRWVVFGTAAALGAQGAELVTFQLIGFHILPLLLGNLVVSLAFLLIPLSLGMAILRYHLFDVDLIVSRTLVYGALTACVVAIYVLAVGSLAVLFGMGDHLAISLVATGVVAVLVQPLRQWLQRGVNRLLYGQRDEPYTVLMQLGHRLDVALAPKGMLPTIVETIAQALKLPYAAIAIHRGSGLVPITTYGTAQGEPVKLPLVYQREPLGELWLCTRTPGESFTPADKRLLEELARQTSTAVHTVQLGVDLQRSREGLVTAREEERRRLRRDLHDGLGPSLAALTMNAEAARDLVRADPAQSEALLSNVITQAQGAIADIRRLVYALRPPALDDLGLIGVIRAQVAHYEQAGLLIAIDAPDRLPALPAAVEVAALRIVQEAVTNVVRHAQATSCTIRLAAQNGVLLAEVTDNGQGVRVDRRAGVGLNSMRERAEELGGICTVETPTAGGVRVRATLPCVLDPAAGTAGEAAPVAGQEE
jgi:signal transduction histidine kinase